ncbi:2-oxoacid:acceptor oxidoreductase subunit alpha [bacterium]|nr:2-oxoacid:acceptor oxidoreductase subunit alpha [bacterium]
MKDISILIGGKSGDGIESTAPIIAKLLASYGYYTHIYRDYPSLIRGGHTFSIIRGSKVKITAIRDKVDVILALNKECVDTHKNLIGKNTVVIYDKDVFETKGIGISLSSKTLEIGAPIVVRNMGLVGALAKTIGIDWNLADKIIENNSPKKPELNVIISKFGFDNSVNKFELVKSKAIKLPLFYGNETVALGLAKAGLDMYIAYPMTPASSVLHFLAEHDKDLNIKVIHPESEIGVIMMANGASYAGSRIAVGTSGGGFALMTEGVSLSGMGEYPVAIVMSQRPGPATGLPTYSAQADLNFVMHSGHGEFSRLVVAPGDAEEAYYWSGQALNLSWKYQIPSFIMVDKTISESVYTFDEKLTKSLKPESGDVWDKKGEYKRYKNTKNGVSPLAFPGDKRAIVKGTSYEHDEHGITIEDGPTSVIMTDKRLKKDVFLEKDIKKINPVNVYGNKKSKIAILCWGSNAGVAKEAAESLGIKVIQPIVLAPFPFESFSKALSGVEKIIDVETNATAQLASLVSQFGVNVDDIILKYDGRPFNVDELTKSLRGLI